MLEHDPPRLVFCLRFRICPLAGQVIMMDEGIPAEHQLIPLAANAEAEVIIPVIMGIIRIIQPHLIKHFPLVEYRRRYQDHPFVPQPRIAVIKFFGLGDHFVVVREAA